MHRQPTNHPQRQPANFCACQEPHQPVRPPCSRLPNQQASLLVRNPVSQICNMYAWTSAANDRASHVIGQPTGHTAPLPVMPPACILDTNHDPLSLLLHFLFFLSCLSSYVLVSIAPLWPSGYHTGPSTSNPKPPTHSTLPFFHLVFIFLMCKKGRPVRIV